MIVASPTALPCHCRNVSAPSLTTRNHFVHWGSQVEKCKVSVGGKKVTSIFYFFLLCILLFHISRCIQLCITFEFFLSRARGWWVRSQRRDQTLQTWTVMMDSRSMWNQRGGNRHLTRKTQQFRFESDTLNTGVHTGFGGFNSPHADYSHSHTTQFYLHTHQTHPTPLQSCNTKACGKRWSGDVTAVGFKERKLLLIIEYIHKSTMYLLTLKAWIFFSWCNHSGFILFSL